MAAEYYRGLKKDLIYEKAYRYNLRSAKREKNVLESEKRERRECFLQITYSQNYIKYLLSMEREIDKYLREPKSHRGAPTTDMIAYAKHNWPYNQLDYEHRYRLSMIRIAVEDHLNGHSLERYKRRIATVKSDEAGNMDCHDCPICSICRDDLNDGDNDDQILTLLRCGHLYHSKCLLTYLGGESTHNCPICRRKFYDLELCITHLSYA